MVGCDFISLYIKRFGISVKVFNSDDASNLEGLVDDKTKAIFF